ncbi:MAG: gluconolaconase [Candidatus Marinimicrobia bacterium]|nr:gluconolaconase [Candidatus Neomarinimicrobiota bacterium]|tara:strand:+ start:374 stop:1240 length:867 start_codon:yes stop_codon:yes gene_type:complete
MERKPEVILNRKNVIGEGILWHADKQCFFWTDIPKAKLFKYKPSTGKAEQWETGTPVGGFTIHQDGRLLLFMAEGAVKLWTDGKFETVIESIPEMKGNRFNDVVADPLGRVFCGVMSTEKSAGWVYRLDPDKSVTKVIQNTGTANGMGFSKDAKRLFFSDSKKSNITIFDYDKASGSLSNSRIILQTSRSEGGSPDGLCMDSDDNIWVGLWEGSAILQMDQNGKEMQRIQFPTSKITTLCFGGEDLRDIFITSAGADDLEQNGQLAGALFHLNLGIKGKTEYRSRFDN